MVDAIHVPSAAGATGQFRNRQSGAKADLKDLSTSRSPGRRPSVRPSGTGCAAPRGRHAMPQLRRRPHRPARRPAAGTIPQAVARPTVPRTAGSRAKAGPVAAGSRPCCDRNVPETGMIRAACSPEPRAIPRVPPPRVISRDVGGRGSPAFVRDAAMLLASERCRLATRWSSADTSGCAGFAAGIPPRWLSCPWRSTG